MIRSFLLFTSPNALKRPLLFRIDWPFLDFILSCLLTTTALSYVSLNKKITSHGNAMLYADVNWYFLGSRLLIWFQSCEFILKFYDNWGHQPSQTWYHFLAPVSLHGMLTRSAGYELSHSCLPSWRISQACSVRVVSPLLASMACWPGNWIRLSHTLSPQPPSPAPYSCGVPHSAVPWLTVGRLILFQPILVIKLHSNLDHYRFLWNIWTWE